MHRASDQRTYKTRAIVLRARNLGEADKILTLLTDTRGKLDTVAKGVRRTKSHFAGRLEFACEAWLTMHRGRNLDVITSAEIVATHWTAIVEPAAFATANLVVELVDAFCEPDLAVPEVYALLQGALGALGVREPAAIVPRFELRLLAALGLAPPSDACVSCGGAFDEGRAWADVDAGGLSCAACRPHRADAFALDARDVENFRALGAPRGRGARPAARATPTAARAIDAFVTYHLGRRPKSTRLLEELAARPAG
jgi:DNA repair protein RecO (recombination protein O)